MLDGISREELAEAYCDSRFCIIVELEGLDSLFTFYFDNPRELVKFLRRTGKGKTKRIPISRIVYLLGS